MNPFAPLPEDLSALSADELRALETEYADAIKKVSASPDEYVGDEMSLEQLFEAASAAVESLKAVRAELAKDEEETEEPEEGAAEVEEPEGDLAARFAELAAETETTDVEEPETAAEVVDEPVEAETVVASAKPKTTARRVARPPASHRPAETEPENVSLVASAAGLGPQIGEPMNELEIAAAMIKRRNSFGPIPEGSAGEQYSIARAEWSDRYPEDRRLGQDAEANLDKIKAVTDPAVIRQAFDARRKNDAGSLVASGGLCAPVTPYYQLAMVSVADRPVRSALPSFNADRGGLRYARPATLASITTGVGHVTAANDALNGTFATKTCQVIDCPPFQETDVETIFHCLQFGNLGARTFPERVAQWNSLTLAAHSRLAESLLLTAIDGFSTAVTATDSSTVPLGASSHLLSQARAAGAAMRSRHRMRPDTVLRAMYPFWVLDLLVSDVYRSQFGRFDMTPEKFVSLLREANIEPSFYIDGATGASQVFGTQSAAALLAFPATVRWYLFPEGSFIYLDGGTLELGLVRDSVLNKTNDFQIFGETFENVAYVGVESLAITSTVCDSGVVSLPALYSECGDYGTS